ncbi:MAG: hypothetical protein ABI670_21025 [Chloroflexota bacterium]
MTKQDADGDNNRNEARDAVDIVSNNIVSAVFEMHARMLHHLTDPKGHCSIYCDNYTLASKATCFMHVRTEQPIDAISAQVRKSLIEDNVYFAQAEVSHLLMARATHFGKLQDDSQAPMLDLGPLPSSSGMIWLEYPLYVDRVGVRLPNEVMGMSWHFVSGEICKSEQHDCLLADSLRINYYSYCPLHNAACPRDSFEWQVGLTLPEASRAEAQRGHTEAAGYLRLLWALADCMRDGSLTERAGNVPGSFRFSRDGHEVEQQQYLHSVQPAEAWSFCPPYLDYWACWGYRPHATM